MAATTDEVVGREQELAALDFFLDAGEEGPAVLLLEGEAGIGKTTLWRAGIRVAESRGRKALVAQPAGAEARLSFAALGDLFADVVETLGALPAPQRRALETALALSDESGAAPDPQAIAIASLGVIRALAADRPVLLALDDIQWLDRPSADVLAYVVRRLRDESIRIVATLRIEARAHLPLGLDRLPGRRLQRLGVGPLSLGALHHLVRGRLGVPLPRPALRRLQETSGGNPFYALEIARALERRAGRLELGQPLPVPRNLHELVHDRLAALPAETREALLAAAALSEPTVGLVETATEHGWNALRPAVEAQVIELDEERIRFSHPLLASVTYGDADLGRRREVHGRLAVAVVDVEERARHLALSTDAPSEQVASVLERTARRARDRGAPDAAADLAEKAAALTPAGFEEQRRCRHMAAAEYRFLAGEGAAAQALLEGAIGETPPGPERARALLRLAEIQYPILGSNGAIETCERALAEPLDDASLQAEIHTNLAFFADLDNPRRAGHARRALELLEVEPGAQPALHASALIAHGLGEYYVGRGLDVEAFERAMSMEATSAGPRAAWRAGSVLGQLLKYTDDYERARAHLEAAYRSAHADADFSSLPDLATHLSELELWTGNWERADRYAREAAETAELAEQEMLRMIASYCRALVDAHLGRVESARALACEAVAFGEQREPWVEGIGLWVLGFLDLSLGDNGAVDRHLSRADDIGEAIGLVEPGQWRFHADHIEALIALGELDDARRRLERLEQRGDAVGRVWALAAAARCRGLLAAAESDLPSAFAAFERAMSEHDRLLHPFERGRTLLALGQTRRRAKQKRAARESLEQALVLFEELGAPLWIEKARGELARIGGRAPSPGELTPTERRVAELAAAGKANKEIAAELHVTVRTVETHLTSIYEKLGIRRRGELARRLSL